MKHYLLTIVLLLTITTSWAQRKQIIAYIDMEYILENVPEYLEAQNTLDEKVVKWKQKLDKQARSIEVLKTDLANEKAILTEDLILEREEEIELKQAEFRRLEALYFGPKGDMFMYRTQLVKPIQDQVYNAIQAIAVRLNYDFVFDKSSDLVMLYSNKKYDISELVLTTIDRTRLSKEKKEKQKEKAESKELNAAQEAAKEKQQAAKDRKLSEIEAKKKALKEKRDALIKRRNEKREQLRLKREALLKKKADAKEKAQEEKKEDQ